MRRFKAGTDLRLPNSNRLFATVLGYTTVKAVNGETYDVAVYQYRNGDEDCDKAALPVISATLTEYLELDFVEYGEAV